MNNKNATLSEQFQNPIEKLIRLTHKYMLGTTTSIKKSLKIPKESSESIYRRKRIDNTMTKRYQF
jgi:uncharacterized protein (DUF2384 family)